MKTYSILAATALLAIFQLSCSSKKEVTKITEPITSEEVKPEPVEEEPVLVKPQPPLDSKPVEEAPVALVVEPSTMAKLLEGRTVFIENKQATRKDVVKNPKQYVFFFAGEWCAKCKERLPEVKTFYNDHIRENPDVEFILASSDQPKWLLKWGADEEFDWPMLFGEDLKSIPFLHKKSSLYAFYFVMYDAEGKSLLTVDMDDCLAIINKVKN